MRIDYGRHIRRVHRPGDFIDFTSNVYTRPLCMQKPVVDGTGVVGSPLSCQAGTWVGANASLSRRWYVDNRQTTITSSLYTVQAADVGGMIYCTETASNTVTGLSTAVQSAPVLGVAA